MRERLPATREDQLAYLRDAPAWRNCLIAELPNGDFAFSIARLLLLTAFTDPFWRAATTLDRQHDQRYRREGGEGDRLSSAPRGRMADPAWRWHRGKPSPRTDGARMICGPILANCSRRLSTATAMPRPRVPYTRCGTRRSIRYWLAGHWHALRMAGCNRAVALGGIPSISVICWRKCSISSGPIRVRHGRCWLPCVERALAALRKSPIRRSRC